MGYDKLDLAVDVDDADNLADGADAQGGEQDGLHPASGPRGEGEEEEQQPQHEQGWPARQGRKSSGSCCHGEAQKASQPV